jgi:hypothetical protein
MRIVKRKRGNQSRAVARLVGFYGQDPTPAIAPRTDTSFFKHWRCCDVAMLEGNRGHVCSRAFIRVVRPAKMGVRRLDPALMGWCLLFVRFNILSPFTSNRLPFHTSAHQHPK